MLVVVCMCRRPCVQHVVRGRACQHHVLKWGQRRLYHLKYNTHTHTNTQDRRDSCILYWFSWLLTKFTQNVQLNIRSSGFTGGRLHLIESVWLPFTLCGHICSKTWQFWGLTVCGLMHQYPTLPPCFQMNQCQCLIHSLFHHQSLLKGLEHIQFCWHTNTHKHAHMHVHTYTHTNTNACATTHTHTHTQPCTQQRCTHKDTQGHTQMDLG